MTFPDLINGCFEASGGIAMIGNIRTILRDKAVAGIDLRVTAFFVAWAFWNLWYYPSLGQWISFFGAAAIGAGNAVWLALAIYYRYARKAACKPK